MTPKSLSLVATAEEMNAGKTVPCPDAVPLRMLYIPPRCQLALRTEAKFTLVLQNPLLNIGILTTIPPLNILVTERQYLHVRVNTDNITHIDKLPARLFLDNSTTTKKIHKTPQRVEATSC